MEYFIKKEIAKLQKLRIMNVIFLLTVNFSIVGLFIYFFNEVYRQRNLKENFISYILPTISYIQLILSLVILPLFLIVYKRFGVLGELKVLNKDFSLLYEDYTNSVDRLFTTLPQYLISQKGLFVFKNFRKVFFPLQSISKIIIKNVNLGRFGRKCHIRFYENDVYKTQTTYSSIYPQEADFLKKKIKIINPSVIFEEI
ncbi:hypothetical protein EZ449_03470 [Pedobacter frigidisoli]|uniref:Uncharacterized protein n=1 Tax=Pedobacter frigidisoli TaxID=2530455 RepID=A0A4R0P8T9_9SPHI|nr:hypothetical protein [Pedobacter frigidisoli]TCD12090.1 hypothetical protein EZ449_03470 [Pedobacter frigidisoli]